LKCLIVYIGLIRIKFKKLKQVLGLSESLQWLSSGSTATTAGSSEVISVPYTVTVAYFLVTNVFCLKINLESPKSFFSVPESFRNLI
jgi:hypothetical protein